MPLDVEPRMKTTLRSRDKLGRNGPTVRLRTRHDAPQLLRYVVYLSDTKLDMLYEQIPARIRPELASEVKVNLSALSLSVNAKSPERDRSRTARLALVERYLAKHHHVGDLASGSGYVRGRLGMDWDVVTDVGDETQIVLFCGYHGDTAIVLGGSATSLMGGIAQPTCQGSQAYALRRALASLGLTAGPSAAGSEDLGRNVVEATEAIYRNPQNVEFLARCLAQGPCVLAC